MAAIGRLWLAHRTASSPPSRARRAPSRSVRSLYAEFSEAVKAPARKRSVGRDRVVVDEATGCEPIQECLGVSQQAHRYCAGRPLRSWHETTHVVRRLELARRSRRRRNSPDSVLRMPASADARDATRTGRRALRDVTQRRATAQAHQLALALGLPNRGYCAKRRRPTTSLTGAIPWQSKRSPCRRAAGRT